MWCPEGVGFEPTTTRQRPSGFQDRSLNLADQRRLQDESRNWHVFGMNALDAPCGSRSQGQLQGRRIASRPPFSRSMRRALIRVVCCSDPEVPCSRWSPGMTFST